MGLSYGTMVVLPDGREAAIERIAGGDLVLAASLGDEELSWSPAAVIFSQGVPEPQPRMSYLVFEDRSELVCTLDQPLLRADGQLVRAARLAPGERLLTPDGGSVELFSHSVSSSIHGVHAFATAGGWEGRPDGHLFAAAGVVAGDWLVEINLPRGS